MSEIYVILTCCVYFQPFTEFSLLCLQCNGQCIGYYMPILGVQLVYAYNWCAMQHFLSPTPSEQTELAFLLSLIPVYSPALACLRNRDCRDWHECLLRL